MKKLLFVLAMIICPFLCNGQSTTDREENYTSFVPLSEIDRQGNLYSFSVKEAYAGEFEENPNKFMEKYFDVHGLLETLEKEKKADLYVTLSGSRGSLDAHFTRKGELKKNFHKCKNVLVPMTVMKQLYKDHKGWNMIENVHITKGRKNSIGKEFYRVKLKKGNSTKRVKIFI